MNLVVDVGNSFIKMAVFDKAMLVVDQIVEPPSFVKRVQEVFEIYPKIKHAIVSSVGNIDEKKVEVLALYCKVHKLSYQSKVPFINRYASPKTLGVDRIALVTAAFYAHHRTNALVIDTGTCITYDFITADGEYLGGSISPGLGMRYRAIHEQTAKLPLLEPAQVPDFIGNTTETAMHSGVFYGIIAEIDGVIDRYKERFEHLTVILTGGDAQIFGKRLKNHIFANSKFLLEGLNNLLEYNKQ